MNGVSLRRSPRPLLLKGGEQCGQMLVIQSFPRRSFGLNGCAECVLVLALSECALVFETIDERIRIVVALKLAE